MTFAFTKVAPAVAFAALVVGASFTPATAEPLEFGPDTCIDGLVWREARDGDTVCVTPAVRSRVASENADPSANRDPDGDYGPESCASGFVWREAFDGDTICVTPAIRSQTLAENADAENNYKRNQPGATPADEEGTGTDVPDDVDTVSLVLEITGSGTVYSITTDPDIGSAGENTAVPWKRTGSVAADVSLVQIVAVGKTGDQGCRITFGGEVVVDQPPGDAHCIFTPE